MSDRIERIRARLTSALAPQALVIEDESDRHAGHAGARDGRGHFRVAVTSASFRGQSALARQVGLSRMNPRPSFCAICK